MGATIKTIFLYPIKSLDGIAVPEAVVLPSGALAHDREFAMVDEPGDWINGKRNARIHKIRARYDLPHMRVSLNSPGFDSADFSMVEDARAIEEWLSGFLGSPVRLQRNTETGFPDDLESPGPTIAGSATVDEIRKWFDLPNHAETLRRFRPNIELAADAPFWEDRLFGRAGIPLVFGLGDVAVHGINPCQRCVVPSRDPVTGVVTENFQRTFSERREATLPSWAEASRFNHYYRFAVNTRIPASEAGKVLRVGDPVRIQDLR